MYVKEKGKIMNLECQKIKPVPRCTSMSALGDSLSKYNLLENKGVGASSFLKK